MIRRVRILLSAFLLFIAGPVWAEEHPPHVVIVADQSGSTFTSGNIGVQTQALVQAVAGLMYHCGEVRVSYIAWGTKPEPAQQFLLHDDMSRAWFSVLLQEDIATHNLGGTQHTAALEAAIVHMQAVLAPRSALLFITDEPGNSQIKIDISINMTIYKVSLGSAGTKRFVENDVLPEIGTARHANNAEELSAVIDEVFDLLVDICLG